jgi:hypothetical protein
MTSSGKSDVCDVMSNQDVAALRHMYPNPVLPPKAFIVAFSGQVKDTVVLSFSVRSTVNPERVSRFTSDAKGHAVVHGFNPEQAEIRVEPWVHWSRVRVDPMTANGLPGGRYTYSVRLA